MSLANEREREYLLGEVWCKYGEFVMTSPNSPDISPALPINIDVCEVIMREDRANVGRTRGPVGSWQRDDVAWCRRSGQAA